METIILITMLLNAEIEYKLPKNLLVALCFVESSHNIHAVHRDDGNSDSLGVCQVKLSTAQWLGFKGTKKEIMIPKNNIKYAAKYLQKQINRYNDITRGIVAYNRGNAKNLTRSKYSDKVHKEWKRFNEQSKKK